jgi:hypothetical protein
MKSLCDSKRKLLAAFRAVEWSGDVSSLHLGQFAAIEHTGAPVLVSSDLLQQVWLVAWPD